MERTWVERHVERPRQQLCGLFLTVCFCFTWLTCPLASADDQVHGLWVWKGPSLIAQADAPGRLRAFCVAHGINQIYISISEQGVPHLDMDFAQLNQQMHGAHVRVEALLSSESADEAGSHRDRLLEHVRSVLSFNQQHDRQQRFDGIHLDIEPQQRPENKGAGNLQFLPGLIDAYREVRALAEPVGLTVNADIQRKLLEGTADQRRRLLSALPRLTLMLYELSRADDGDSDAQKLQTLRDASHRLLAMAYDGLPEPGLARLVIGLRTPDYGPMMPAMLAALDEAYRTEPHYLGWAWHEYADALGIRE